MVSNGSVGVQRDREESNFLTVGDLAFVGSTLLEDLVATTIGGGVGANKPETGRVAHSRLEVRESLYGVLRGFIRAIWVRSIPRRVQ